MAEFWLCYDSFEMERNKRAIEFYAQSCKKRGIDLRLLLPEEADFSRPPDAAIVRAPDAELREKLEDMGVLVYNSSRVCKIANDKMETFEYLSSRGVKCVETYLVTEDFLPPFYPIVLKPARGHGGKGVKMIGNEGEFYAYKRESGERCIAQRPVSDLGRDLRVYSIGGRIFAAMLRESDTDFRSNFCLGGRACAYELSKDERLEAEKIISLFDKGYFGVDFIFDRGKIIFNEIEDAVGARMLYTYTSLDPIDCFVDFIAREASARK